MTPSVAQATYVASNDMIMVVSEPARKLQQTVLTWFEVLCSYLSGGEGIRSPCRDSNRALSEPKWGSLPLEPKMLFVNFS